MFVRPNVIRAILAIDNSLYWCSHQWERFTWWFENIKWEVVLDAIKTVVCVVAITVCPALLALIAGWTETLLVPWAVMTGIALKFFVMRWIWRRVVRWAEEQQKIAIEIGQKLEGQQSKGWQGGPL